MSFSCMRRPTRQLNLLTILILPSTTFYYLV